MIGLVIVDFGPELDSAGVEEVLRTMAEMPRSYGSPDDIQNGSSRGARSATKTSCADLPGTTYGPTPRMVGY